MSYPLRQNTAETILIGPFVDTSGAALTSLTIAQADRKWKKFGSATLANTSDTGNATHVSGGWYSMPVTTTDSNTAGPMKLSVQKSGALLYFEDFEVFPAAAYDARFINPLIARAVHYGTAQAGGGSLSMILAAAASSVDNAFRYALVHIYEGTGADQWNYATGYTGSSRALAVAYTWPIATPDATSKYMIFPAMPLSTLDAVADAVWDEAMSGALGAHNARPTARQGMAELVLGGRTVVQSGNNLLTKDTDGMTTVRTRALSPDATTPTSRTVTG